jgi:hypothetical protein
MRPAETVNSYLEQLGREYRAFVPTRMVRVVKDPAYIVEKIRFNQQYPQNIGRRNTYDVPLCPLVYLSCAGRTGQARPVALTPRTAPVSLG